MRKYRFLNAGETIRRGDEFDACNDPWRDEPKWKPVRRRIGQTAPNPSYPAHTIYRRKISKRKPVPTDLKREGDR